MPFYRCDIRGVHFPAQLMGGGTGRCGFVTTRWLEAADPADAELKCVDMLRGERSFLWRGKPERMADARVYVEKIDEVAALPKSRGGGATWFKE